MNLSATTLLAAGLASAMTTSASAQLNYFANGSFETPGVTTPALGWLNAAEGYTLSSDARTGNFALQLSSPTTNAAVALQNSVDDGLQPPLVPGDTPQLSFWAKGFAGTTGNVGFALRYLDATGAILDGGGFQFQNDINETTYSEFTFALAAIPLTATSAFIEFSQAIGPIDGIDFLGGTVLIDDVALISTIPEPASMALLGASGLVLMGRRRRSA